MKCIELSIYKPSTGDCSNGGISSKYNHILLEHPNGWVNVNPAEPPENLCKIVKRNLFGSEYIHIEPVEPVPTGCVGYMSGGCTVDTSDSRWHELSHYPVRLHDRTETTKQYDALSR